MSSLVSANGPSETSTSPFRTRPATRADLLRRLGRSDEAADAYREALALAGTAAEQRYLSRRLAEVIGSG